MYTQIIFITIFSFWIRIFMFQVYTVVYQKIWTLNSIKYYEKKSVYIKLRPYPVCGHHCLVKVRPTQKLSDRKVIDKIHCIWCTFLLIQNFFYQNNATLSIFTLAILEKLPRDKLYTYNTSFSFFRVNKKEKIV